MWSSCLKKDLIVSVSSVNQAAHCCQSGCQRALTHIMQLICNKLLDHSVRIGN